MKEEIKINIKHNYGNWRGLYCSSHLQSREILNEPLIYSDVIVVSYDGTEIKSQSDKTLAAFYRINQLVYHGVIQPISKTLHFLSLPVIQQDASF